MPLTTAAVVGGISALGKIGTGVGQLISGNRKAKNNIRPEFNIQDEYYDNRDIAAREAQRDLSDRSIELYNDRASRGLGSATGAMLQAGGGINSIQGAYDSYLQGARAVAAQDADLQSKNIATFIDQNNTLAKQKVQQWVLNKYQPYKDIAAAAAQEKSSGLQNIFTGASEGASILSNMSIADQYKDLLPGNSPNQGASHDMTPSASTTYSNGYGPNSSYGAFEDPYYVPPVSERASQAQTQAQAAASQAGLSQEQIENLVRTYKGKI